MRKHWPFICILLGTAIISIPFHNGLTLWDEGSYVHLGLRLAQGTPISMTEGVFANRIGTYGIAAVIIKIFGFNEHITWGFTAFFFLLLTGIYFCLVEQDKKIAWSTVLILGTSPILIQESSRVMSDVIGGITASAPILIYYYFLKNQKWGPLRMGIIAGLIFSFSVITRESFVFIIPATVWIAFTAARKDFWIATCGTIAIIGAFIFAEYWAHGDPFIRCKLLSTGPLADDCGYAMVGTLGKLKRMTYQPFQFLTENYSYGILLLIAGLNFFGPTKKDDKLIKPYLLVTLAFFWLYPETIKHWNPVALSPRLWIPLIIPLTLNAAYGIAKIDTIASKHKKSATVFILLFLICTFIVLLVSRYEHISRGIPEFSRLLFLTYLAISGILITVIWMRRITVRRTLITLTVVLSQLTALFAGRIIGSNGQNAENFSCEKQVLISIAKKARGGATIITDQALATNFCIYGSFPTIRFVNFETISVDALAKQRRPVFLYLNAQRLNILRNNINETETYTVATFLKLPPYVEKPDQFFRCIDSTSQYRVLILQ